ncbi:uncharacterized protein LOC114174046 [Vigna unguiculata]|uniref:VQ domain-containing protein n=1 Tax=Vigna unguiculata TaxID=3917 RepID=A0A4D6LTY4_VIGUN|nr:uncharacterized protein LOC114174046 [Vigna unguiculata]QCD91424.1 hypothetical protein DEO72_LG4g2389 [Vigna unguiculata]
MEAYSSSYPAASKSNSLLHSVRKAQAKPWKKAPVAPVAPTPIRVYKVDAINFRDLVQRLTGAPEFNPELHNQLFQRVSPIATAPPSRDNIVAPPSTVSSTNWYQGQKPQTLELNLSSSSPYNWCSVPRTTQGTMATLEPGRVL